MEIFDYKLEKKSRKNLVNFIFIYLMIQPILSYYVFFSDTIRSKFLISPSTLIRVFGFIGIFIYFFYNCKDKRKLIKLLIGVFIVFGLYALLHIFFALKIDFLPDNFSFSFFQEIFYLFRMLIPFFMFLIIYNIKFKAEEIFPLLFYSSLIISLTIIVTNILGVSLVSYSEKIEPISQNFLSWFSTKNTMADFTHMTSKGFFLYANEIGNVLLMLLPVNILIFYRKVNIQNAIGLSCTLLAMLMIGTRVAFLGVYIVLFSFLLIYVFVKIVNKEKIVSEFLYLFLLISCVFLFLSTLAPTAIRLNLLAIIHNNLSFETTYIVLIFIILINFFISNRSEVNIKKNSILLLILFCFLFLDIFTVKKFGIRDGINTGVIEEDSSEASVYKDFHTKIYPYSYDSEFWDSLFSGSPERYNNTRKVQSLIFDRIMYKSTVNHGNVYKVFGLSYSNFRNSNAYNIYLEKDLLAHYYTLGLIGIILYFGPYFLFLIYSGIYVLKRLKKGVTLENIVIPATLLIVIATSYSGGHVFDEMLPTILLSAIISLFFIKKKGEKNEI